MTDSAVERKAEQRRTALSLTVSVLITVCAIVAVACIPNAPLNWMAGLAIIFGGTRLEHWYFSPQRWK